MVSYQAGGYGKGRIRGGILKKTTKRPISAGAEKWLDKEIPILDHGFLRLIDYMGNDEAIEQAARVSYGTGTRKTTETRGLIRYLLRNQHTSPFEMVELKFHAKMPIFVARQWVRHRTASINEISARYSVLDKEFYIPESGVLAKQATDNKQGRGEIVDLAVAKKVKKLLMTDATLNYSHYEQMLSDVGLAKELARMDLTLNFYTQWYWKANLHNIFHFLKLRMDPHAQYEIRVYADAMAKIVKDIVPISYEAFNDYRLEAISLSGMEKNILSSLLSDLGMNVNEESVIEKCGILGISNKREREEIVRKLKLLGLLK